MQLAGPKGYVVLKEEENKPVEKKRKLELVSEARYSCGVDDKGRKRRKLERALGGEGCRAGHIAEGKYFKDLECGGDAEPLKATAHVVTQSCATMSFTGPDSAHIVLRL